MRAPLAPASVAIPARDQRQRRRPVRLLLAAVLAPLALSALLLPASAAPASVDCADYSSVPVTHAISVLEGSHRSPVLVGDVLVTLRDLDQIQGWIGAGTELPQPGQVHTSPDGAGYHALAAHGDRLYAAASWAGVRTFRLVGTLLIETAMLQAGRTVKSVATATGRLVIARSDWTVLLYDLAGPSPVLVDSLALGPVAPDGLRGAGEIVLAQTTSPPTLHVVDPVAASIQGSVSLPWTAEIVSFDGELAVLSEDGGSDRRLVDVRDPAAPGVLPMPATPGLIIEGGAMVAGQLWLGGGDPYTGGILARWDVSDPAAPVHLGTQPWVGTIRGAVAAGAVVHLLTEDIFFVTPIPPSLVTVTPGRAAGSGPASPAPGPIGHLDDPPGHGQRTAALGNLYLRLGYSDLAVIDLADPTAPVAAGTAEHELSTLGLHLAATDGYAVVVGKVDDGPVPDRGRILVYDVSDPAAPTLRSTTVTQRVGKLAAADSRIYAWGLDDRLRVWEITSAGQLTLLGDVTLPGVGDVLDLLAVGDLLLTIDQDHDLVFWDVTLADAPQPWADAPAHGLGSVYRLVPWPGGAAWGGNAASDLFAWRVMTLDGQGLPAVQQLWEEGTASGEVWYGNLVGDGTRAYLGSDLGGLLVLELLEGQVLPAGLVPCFSSGAHLVGGCLVTERFELLEVWAPGCGAITAAPASPPVPPAPASLVLAPARPNPFNPRTVIGFVLPRAAHVQLAVFDLRGRRVADLVDGPLPAGPHAVTWDARSTASGVYLCRLQAAGEVATRKVLLAR